MDAGSPAPGSDSGQKGSNVTSDRPDPAKDIAESNMADDIDPANEVQGVKLVVIHLSICLCTFLIGLVSAQGFKLKTAKK